VNLLSASSSYIRGSILISESKDRKELKQRLAQAKRIADGALDPLTKERLQRLVKELEEQLRLSRD
jgi:hypothetical protein